MSRTILRWPVLNWRLLAGSLFASSNGERFDSWEALYRSGLLARDQGRFAEARQQLEAALSHSELSMQDVRRAEIYCSLAYVYQTLGEQPKADFHYSAAQSIIGNHPDLETSVLATILSEIGLYRLDQRAFQASQKAFGDQDLTTAMARARLSRYYRDAGNLAVAENLLNRAIEVYEKARPSRSVDWLMAATAGRAPLPSSDLDPQMPFGSPEMLLQAIAVLLRSFVDRGDTVQSRSGS